MKIIKIKTSPSMGKGGNKTNCCGGVGGKGSPC